MKPLDTLKERGTRNKDFYLTCINEYAEAAHISSSSIKNRKPIKDFNIYLGALIYPKELESILQKKSQKHIAKEIYDALYKFSLGKMKSILVKDPIFNLFLNYHDREIVNGNRLELNKTMSQHQGLYLEAYRVMKKINKRTKSLF
jgi:hypothetical protein